MLVLIVSCRVLFLCSLTVDHDSSSYIFGLPIDTAGVVSVCDDLSTKTRDITELSRLEALCNRHPHHHKEEVRDLLPPLW